MDDETPRLKRHWRRCLGGYVLLIVGITFVLYMVEPMKIWLRGLGNGTGPIVLSFVYLGLIWPWQRLTATICPHCDRRTLECTGILTGIAHRCRNCGVRSQVQ